MQLPLVVYPMDVFDRTILTIADGPFCYVAVQTDSPFQIPG